MIVGRERVKELWGFENAVCACVAFDNEEGEALLVRLEPRQIPNNRDGFSPPRLPSFQVVNYLPL